MAERNSKEKEYIFKRTRGDLFTAPEHYSLAHCVSEDLSMGKGIAVEFKERFKRVDELMAQNVRVGGVAVLKISPKRFIYYLITKKAARDKPTIEDFHSSIKALRDHCVDNDVTHLAVPMLGTGLDQLPLSTVLQSLEKVFGNVKITVNMYHLGQL